MTALAEAAPAETAPAALAWASPSTVTVVTSRCQGCGACLLTCPERAIRPLGGPARATPATGAIGPTGGPARLIVLEKLCTGCGECVEVCPVDAIDLACAPGETGEET
jgi:ferredoxin